MLALTAAKFGTRPSQLLRLADDAVALDFDSAAAMKLQQWEDERTAQMWGGGGDERTEVRFDGP